MPLSSRFCICHGHLVAFVVLPPWSRCLHLHRRRRHRGGDGNRNDTCHRHYAGGAGHRRAGASTTLVIVVALVLGVVVLMLVVLVYHRCAWSATPLETAGGDCMNQNNTMSCSPYGQQNRQGNPIPIRANILSLPKPDFPPFVDEDSRSSKNILNTGNNTTRSRSALLQREARRGSNYPRPYSRVSSCILPVKSQDS